MSATVESIVSSVNKALTLVEQGIALKKQNKLADALLLFDQAIELHPKLASAYFYRVMIYHEQGKKELMLQDIRSTIALDPHNAKMLSTFGRNLLSHQVYVDAIRLFQSAIELSPNDEDAWLGLADAHYLIGNSASALKMYEHLVRKFPHNPLIRLADALFVPPIAASKEEIEQSRDRLVQKLNQLIKEGFVSDDSLKGMRSTLFYLFYHNHNHKPMSQLLARFFAQAFPKLHYTAVHCKNPRKKRPAKLKLGFISPSMHVPTINQFFLAIMEKLSADQDFDIVVFSNAPANNPTAQDAMKRVKRYVVLPSDLESSRELIAKEEMDILVYLEIGVNNLMYQLGFARLAPVQCVWGGVPATTGIPNMDYFLTCRDAEPENCQEHYTETPAMTSRTVCLIEKPKINAPLKTRAELGLPENVKLYTCPVLLTKLHPDMDQIFAHILARDPHAMIVLFDLTNTLAQNHIRDRLARAIPSDDMPRVLFLPFASADKFLHILRAVDCVLDPFHYSFGSTAYLAFGVGVPFVTMTGTYMNGRAGMRMYNHIGLPQMIATTPEEYVDLAIRLANDKPFYDEMAKHIAEYSDVFFNDYAVVDEFSALLKELYFDR